MRKDGLNSDPGGLTPSPPVKTIPLLTLPPLVFKYSGVQTNASPLSSTSFRCAIILLR